MRKQNTSLALASIGLRLATQNFAPYRLAAFVWVCCCWIDWRKSDCVLDETDIYVINTETALHWVQFIAKYRTLSHFQTLWSSLFFISISNTGCVCERGTERKFIKLYDRMKPKNRSNETEFPFHRDVGSHALFRSRKEHAKLLWLPKTFNWYATMSPSSSSSSSESFLFSIWQFPVFFFYRKTLFRCQLNVRPKNTADLLLSHRRHNVCS